MDNVGLTVTMRWENAEYGLSVKGGQPEPDFERYTFRAPRPGLFVGDCPAGIGAPQLAEALRLVEDGQGIAVPPCPKERPFLGSLDAFPDEILIRILEFTDPCGAVAFRAVNDRARDLVESIVAFQTTKAFPKLLDAVILLQCQDYSISDLAESIKNTDCQWCGHFGDFLYLIIPFRICYYCFRSPRTAAMDPVVNFANQDAHRLPVPTVTVPPGTYGLGTNRFLKRPHLAMDRRAFFARYPNRTALRDVDDARLRLHAAIVRRFDDPDYEQRVRGRMDPSADPPTWRYAATMRAPYLDPESGRFEEGFLCRACAQQGLESDGIARYVNLRPPTWAEPWRRYTRDGMRRHLETHGAVWYLADGSRLAHSGRLAMNVGGGGEDEGPQEQPSVPCCGELLRIGDVLRRCRDKIIEFPQLQPYQASWFCVEPTGTTLVCRAHGALFHSCTCV
jgi:hypothetical protein